MLQALEKALELDPADPRTLTSLGRRYLDRGHLDRAETLAREALEVAPEHQEALVLMGHVLLRRGRVEEAREHAVWALQGNPRNRGALHLIVSVKARTNWFLGLWWRYAVRLGTLGRIGAVLVVLAAMYLGSMVVGAIALWGYTTLAAALSFLWPCFLFHALFSKVIFDRMLRRELAQLRLRRSF
jgi:tetratricopeptide (TPR) repeat protein